MGRVPGARRVAFQGARIDGKAEMGRISRRLGSKGGAGRGACLQRRGNNLTQSQSTLSALRKASLDRISSFATKSLQAGPNPSLPTLLVTVRSSAPDSYLPPVLAALEGKALPTVLLPRDCRDLKGALTSLARGLAESGEKFFGLEKPGDDDQEEDDDGAYLKLARKSGKGRIPTQDGTWSAAWWRSIVAISRKRGIVPPTPVVLVPALPAHTSLPALIRSLRAFQGSVPFRIVFFSPPGDLSDYLPLGILALLEVTRETMVGEREAVWAGWLGLPFVNPLAAATVEVKCDDGAEMLLGRRAMGYLASRAQDWEGGADGILSGLKVVASSDWTLPLTFVTVLRHVVVLRAPLFPALCSWS